MTSCYLPINRFPNAYSETIRDTGIYAFSVTVHVDSLFIVHRGNIGSVTPISFISTEPVRGWEVWGNARHMMVGHCAVE